MEIHVGEAPFAQCNEILRFLTFGGKDNLADHINQLHHGVMEEFGKIYIANFERLLTDLVYPTFQKVFSQYHQANESGNGVLTITTSQCDTMVDCSLALNAIEVLIRKLYNTFTVLSSKFELDIRQQYLPFSQPQHHKWGENIGTVVSDTNFLMDLRYEQPVSYTHLRAHET